MKLTINVEHGANEYLRSLLGRGVCALESLAKDLHLIRLKYNPLTSDVAGVNVTQTGEVPMAGKIKVLVMKKAGLAQARKATKQATPKAGRHVRHRRRRPGRLPDDGPRLRDSSAAGGH